MPFPSSSLAQSGKYTQIQLIGQGAEGNIYRARDNLDRAVAIKEALPNRRGFFDRQERFEKAVRLQAMLIHPNIVAVYHLRPLRGRDYAEALGRAPLPGRFVIPARRGRSAWV